jgi:uncharacterized protein YhfF
VNIDRGKTFELGFPGPTRDRLIAAVLRGEKTATSSLLVEWELEGEPLPHAGERRILVDSAGKAAGTVELLRAEVIRLGDVDADLARDEGEGFSSVAEWRDAHERFWRDQVIPTLPSGTSDELSDKTSIVVERFRLVS